MMKEEKMKRGRLPPKESLPPFFNLCLMKGRRGRGKKSYLIFSLLSLVSISLRSASRAFHPVGFWGEESYPLLLSGIHISRQLKEEFSFLWQINKREKGASHVSGADWLASFSSSLSLPPKQSGLPCSHPPSRLAPWSDSLFGIERRSSPHSRISKSEILRIQCRPFAPVF